MYQEYIHVFVTEPLDSIRSHQGNEFLLFISNTFQVRPLVDHLLPHLPVSVVLDFLGLELNGFQLHLGPIGPQQLLQQQQHLADLKQL